MATAFTEQQLEQIKNQIKEYNLQCLTFDEFQVQMKQTFEVIQAIFQYKKKKRFIRVNDYIRKRTTTSFSDSELEHLIKLEEKQLAQIQLAHADDERKHHNMLETADLFRYTHDEHILINPDGTYHGLLIAARCEDKEYNNSISCMCPVSVKVEEGGLYDMSYNVEVILPNTKSKTALITESVLKLQTTMSSLNPNLEIFDYTEIFTKLFEHTILEHLGLRLFDEYVTDENGETHYNKHLNQFRLLYMNQFLGNILAMYLGHNLSEETINSEPYLLAKMIQLNGLPENKVKELEQIQEQINQIKKGLTDNDKEKVEEMD